MSRTSTLAPGIDSGERVRLSAGKAALVGAIAALLALVLDQATKAFVIQRVSEAGDIAVTPFFALVANLNPGTAFGLASGAGPWILVGIALALCAWLATMLIKARTLTQALALGVVIGGALGNVADRLRFGAVRDFLDLHWHSWHWPAFNLADTFVVLGLLLFVLVGGGESERPRQPRLTEEGSRDER